jgi:hypothetical protein
MSKKYRQELHNKIMEYYALHPLMPFDLKKMSSHINEPVFILDSFIRKMERKLQMKARKTLHPNFSQLRGSSEL